MTSTTTSTTTSTSPRPPKFDPLPDHYYFSDQDDPLDYYDNVDEISIPSSSIIKSLHNHNKTHSSSSIKSSSSTLSQSAAPTQLYMHVNEPAHMNRLQFKLPDFSESRYDQSTLKSYFMISPAPSKEFPVSYETYRTTPAPVTTTPNVEVQRQKILSFIVSENQPSSFKAPSSSITQKPRASLILSATNKEINSHHNFYQAFVNTQESTTQLYPNTTSTNPPRALNPTKTTVLLSEPKKSIRLTLSSSLEPSPASRSVAQSSRSQITQGSVVEIPLIKSRQPETLQLRPIEPTTYSPSKSFRTSIETTSTSTHMPSSFQFEDDVSENEPFVVHSRRRPYVNDFLTNANNIPTRFPPRSTTSTTTEGTIDVSEFTTQAPSSTTTFRSIIQSFTSRNLVFKESLNRTFEPQNLKPIVSPYISLETQRLTNAIRTTSPRPYEPMTSTTQKPVTSTASSSSLPLVPSTYRSYFLITAPVKEKSSIPSTFLFPETSTIKSSSLLTTSTAAPPTNRPSPFSLNTEASTTENSRGRYRPFVTFTSQNSIGDEPTTYAPRLRFNTRTQTMVDSVSSSTTPIDQPVVRRKIVRLKSALQPPQKPVDDLSTPSTTFNRFAEVSTLPTPLRAVAEKFIASPSRDSSQFKPIESKSNDFVNKLSYSSDSPITVARPVTNSFNQLTKNKDLRNNNFPIIDVINKPFYYIRFKNASGVSFEPLETSTKRFRATVEMPEMNVPTEKELNAYVDTAEHEEVYDEEENDRDHQNPLDIVENDDEYENNRGEHEVDDYAYVDSSSSTVSPSTYDRIPFNSTYSTLYATSPPTTTSTTLTSTSLRTTERTPTTTTTTTSTTTSTTTANPKSLIPPRTSRVNNAIKTSIVAGLPRGKSASIKCNDISANAKCNEIPSRYYISFSEPPKITIQKQLFSIR